MIEALFTELTVELKVEAEDWEDAVRYGGRLLQRAGYAEARYTEAMVDTIKRLGGYIVIAPGLAMPHVRPECGARALGMSLVHLAHPVWFGSEENDPVDIIISLCARDNSSHLDALGELMRLVEDEALWAGIRGGLCKEKVIEYIQQGKFLHG